ncbi:uncharacterized protein J7T54_003568, partial [Emericellopsis cladophorae]
CRCPTSIRVPACGGTLSSSSATTPSSLLSRPQFSSSFCVWAGTTAPYSRPSGPSLSSTYAISSRFSLGPCSSVCRSRQTGTLSCADPSTFYIDN